MGDFLGRFLCCIPFFPSNFHIHFSYVHLLCIFGWTDNAVGTSEARKINRWGGPHGELRMRAYVIWVACCGMSIRGRRVANILDAIVSALKPPDPIRTLKLRVLGWVVVLGWVGDLLESHRVAFLFFPRIFTFTSLTYIFLMHLWSTVMRWENKMVRWPHVENLWCRAAQLGWRIVVRA